MFILRHFYLSELLIEGIIAIPLRNQSIIMIKILKIALAILLFLPVYSLAEAQTPEDIPINELFPPGNNLTTQVSNMLGNLSAWGQTSSPYNDYTPTVAGHQTDVGCVNIAFYISSNLNGTFSLPALAAQTLSTFLYSDVT